jgi:hypothetical protein
MVHPFQHCFEAIEPVAPESAVEAHPIYQRRQSFLLGAVMSLTSVSPVAYESGKLQDTQVFGYRGLRDTRVAGQHSHGLFAVAAQPLEDCPAGWIGKGLKKAVGGGIHEEFITIWL